MVDTASIVIAIISLLSSLASAGFTAFITYYIESAKRRSTARALTDKYRDPLTLSAYELQSRIYNLVDQGLLTYLQYSEEVKSTHTELVRVYTAYLIGQYFSWAYIFRREAQFLRFSTDSQNREMNRIMASITSVMSTDEHDGEDAFMLWRGQQLAIGELMTARDEDGQLRCIGYAAFASKYAEDLQFRNWFEHVEDGITALLEARSVGNPVVANRLRRLQHLLVDLVLLIGGDLLAQESFKVRKVTGAPGCKCMSC